MAKVKNKVVHVYPEAGLCVELLEFVEESDQEKAMSLLMKIAEDAFIRGFDTATKLKIKSIKK